MNQNDTKKMMEMISFMKEHGVTELEYTTKGTSIKLRLDPQTFQKAAAAVTEPVTEPAVEQSSRKEEEIGIRDVTTYTAEAAEPTLPEEAEVMSEEEQPSMLIKTVVAAESVKRHAGYAVDAVKDSAKGMRNLFKRSMGEKALTEADEDATELDLMYDHEKEVKEEAPRGLFRRFRGKKKNHEDAVAFADATQKDNIVPVDGVETAETEGLDEEMEIISAEVEETAVKKDQGLKKLLVRIRRKKKAQEEEVNSDEETELTDTAEETLEDALSEDTEEVTEAVEEAAAEVTEEAAETVEDEKTAEAVEETVEAPAEEVSEEVTEAVEMTEEVTEETAEPVEEEEEEVSEEAAPTESEEEPAEEEEPSKEDALFGIVG